MHSNRSSRATSWFDGVSVTTPRADLPGPRSRVGMVFQHFERFPHLSVADNLMLAQVRVLVALMSQCGESSLSRNDERCL
jgi:glutamate/aspartate transport system ATP-binding protein